MWVRINYLARLRGDEGTRQAATARLADVFLIVFGAMKLRGSGGMSYTRVWIHREVLDSKIHSVLVLGVLIGSVSNNTNIEFRQSYSLICIWMKIHQTESFAYLCEFSLPSAPSLRACSGFYKHFVWHLHIFIRFHCSACFNKRKRQPRRFASVSPCVQKTTQPVWTPICLTVRQRFIWAIWTLVRVTVGS